MFSPHNLSILWLSFGCHWHVYSCLWGFLSMLVCCFSQGILGNLSITLMVYSLKSLITSASSFEIFLLVCLHFAYFSILEFSSWVILIICSSHWTDCKQSRKNGTDRLVILCTRVEAETEEARRLSLTTGEKNNLKMPLVEEVHRGNKCLGPWVEEFQLLSTQ